MNETGRERDPTFHSHINGGEHRRDIEDIEGQSPILKL
jgi:hypothetical protein